MKKVKESGLTQDYTVLLSRPDYIADDPLDTYCDHVSETSEKKAVAKARGNAKKADRSEGEPTDYALLFVCKGHVRDLSFEAE